jgi:hypothetical protein
MALRTSLVVEVVDYRDPAHFLTSNPVDESDDDDDGSDSSSIATVEDSPETRSKIWRLYH